MIVTTHPPSRVTGQLQMICGCKRLENERSKGYVWGATSLLSTSS
jgi:hypothetical protein